MWSTRNPLEIQRCRHKDKDTDAKTKGRRKLCRDCTNFKKLEFCIN